VAVAKDWPEQRSLTKKCARLRMPRGRAAGEGLHTARRRD